MLQLTAVKNEEFSFFLSSKEKDKKIDLLKFQRDFNKSKKEKNVIFNQNLTIVTRICYEDEFLNFLIALNKKNIEILLKIKTDNYDYWNYFLKINDKTISMSRFQDATHFNDKILSINLTEIVKKEIIKKIIVPVIGCKSTFIFSITKYK